MSLRNQLKNLNVGMSRKSLSLSPHDTNWFKAFNVANISLKEQVPKDLELHHIGSTSIPGIHAKPILDILGVVPSIEAFDNNRPELESWDLSGRANTELLVGDIVFSTMKAKNLG